MTMRTLSIDIETYSSRDLTKCGVYAYVQAKDFEILLFGYAFDNISADRVSVIDFKSGEKLPSHVKAALSDKTIIKTAFNASFERTCIAAYFNMDMIPEQWRCSAVQALSLGLPQSLDGVSKSLNLITQKGSEGKALIRYFSIPSRGSGVNGLPNRNLPRDDMDKWNSFKSYCMQDVQVEREIRVQLEKFQITESEQKLWCLDQRINDRGVRLQTDIIKHALAFDGKYQERLNREAIALTGVKNPKSAAQMKKWLFDKEGLQVETLSKEMVEKLLKETENHEVARALKLRQELSKTSIKKYEAMSRALCRDNRIRGLLKFYGANRTGRWTGTLVQVQNLPRNKLKDLDLARNLLRKGQYEVMEMLFSSVPEVLSQLIRTTFIPSINSRFIVADFSAIEARVIAWLADEKWRMEVFNSHGKIYEASAAQMFKVPLEAVTKDSHFRQKGKISELALGYQGGAGALIAMGALNMGLSEEELPKLVVAFRNSNPNIVKLWSEVEKAAISVVRDNITITIQKGIELSHDRGILFIKLPSGRRLSYVNVRIERDERFNKPMITYEGLSQGTKQWGRLSTYGGKLVENIVQATAMSRLDEAGYNIVMHVHDEVVIDAANGFGSVQQTAEIMGTPIYWAKGLPLRADVFETNYYKKD